MRIDQVPLDDRATIGVTAVGPQARVINTSSIYLHEILSLKVSHKRCV